MVSLMNSRFFKKRLIAAILAAIFVLPLLIVQTTAAGEAEISVIAWNEPAIPCNAGQNIDLTMIHLGVSATETINASNIKWKNGDSEITSFTPPQAGVYPLTATYGTKSKNVYVVAKNTNDTDYVLYTNDFDSQDSISDWQALIANDANIKVKDSKLVIDAITTDSRRILLPAWLGEFGNYKITASVSSSDEKDTGRWNSIMYRIQNNNYPYYHMCVRKNTSTSNGIEYAIRTPANAWNVVTTGSYSSNQVTGTYYTYTVKVKNNVILYSFNNKNVVFNDDKKDYQVGRLGLQANYSVMYVDKITVALQLDTPDYDVSPTLIETTATVNNIQNAFANVAEITNAASFTTLNNSHSAVIYTDGVKITAPDGTAIDDLSKVYDLIGKNVIPVFYCKTKEAVNGVIDLLISKSANDAAVMSNDPTIVKYARTRTNYKLLRGIIDFRDKYTKELSMAEIAAIRKTVNANLAKTAVINSSCLSRLAVDELCELLLTVWAYDDCATPEEAAESLVLGTHGILSPNPNKVFEAYSLFEADTLTRTPLIIGHRGNPSLSPENSISSYALAFENGADIVETDVYLSKDNEVVVMHDGSIDRTTTGTGNIESMTLEEIKQYYLWGDNDAYRNKYPEEKIPTLRELLELGKGKDLKVFIEIKSSKDIICKYIADLLREYDMVNQVCVISFSLVQCKNMQIYAPEVSCGYLTSAVTQASSQRLANSALFTMMPSLLDYNTTLNPSNGNITDRLAEVAVIRGVTIWPWTYATGSATQFTNAFIWGYGGLTTNDSQYTKNTVKYISANVKEVNLLNGKAFDYNVSSVTYGRVNADVTSKAKVKVLSGDSVTVENGKITAVKAGQTNLVFYYTTKTPNNTSYTLYTEAVTVNVLGADEFGIITPLSSSRLTDNGSVITGIGFKTTPSQLVKEFRNTELKITKNGAQLSDTAFVGTGCLLESYADGVLKESRKLVVRADMSGNGTIEKDDYIMLRLMILGIGAFIEEQKYAADADGNNAITVTDYIAIRLHLLGIVEMNPN